MDAIGPTDIIAFRSRPPGSEAWDFILPAKPKGASTLREGPTSFREVCTREGNITSVVSDMDAAWMIRDGGMLKDDAFTDPELGILSEINRNYGWDVCNMDLTSMAY